MSLQIWLPLNGNLKNQGLSKVTVINNGATINNNGKIGKCYYFNGDATRLKIANPITDSMNQFSLCCWFYMDSSANKGTFFGARSSGSGKGILCFVSKAENFFLFDDGTRFQLSYNITNLIGSWHHITFVKTPTQKKIYLDGQLIGSQNKQTTTANIRNELTIGNDTYEVYQGNGLKGYLNDVRIYDHALSAKEVKEISNALVLHFKFNDFIKPIINTNLLLDTDVPSLTAVQASKNRYISSSDAGGYTMTWEKLADPPIPTIEYGVRQIITDASRGHTITWYNGGTITTTIGQIYTMSCYVKVISGGDDLNFLFEYGKDPYVDSPYIKLINDGQWHQYSWTYTVSNNGAAASNTTRIYCGTLKSVGEILMCGWKLEQADAASPYIQRHGRICDSSGYQHYAELTGNTWELVNDTPRYDKALHFTNTAQKIRIPNLITIGFSDSYTFSWWGKISTYSNKMFWGFEDGIKLNGIYNGVYWNTGDGVDNPLLIPGTSTKVTPPTANKWHHFVMVGNGNDNTCKVYIDGELYGVATTYKSISGTKIIINGWNMKTNYSSDNMSISDFRLYATALDDNEIKKLYNISGAIDNNNNLYIRELVE